MWHVAVLLGLGLGLSSLGSASSMHILTLPSDPLQVVPDLIFHSPCEFFGFQYSMEVAFSQIPRDNWEMATADGQYADFVLVEHCVSKVYFALREKHRMDHYQAIHTADKHYLVPIIKHAIAHPLYQTFQGRNFVLVLAMDLGRRDFPLANALIQHWTVGCLTGQPNWLETHYTPTRTHIQDMLDEASDVKAARDWKIQDFVISIPTRFRLHAKSQMGGEMRPVLFFFAGTLNSPTRERLHQVYSVGEAGSMRTNSTNVTDVVVTSRFRKDPEYRQHMWKSKYCIVAKGSSHTNNVRLYDVIMHGCIPVIISTDFVPPLQDLLDWHSFAVFLHPSQVDDLEEILRGIDDQTRQGLFQNLVLTQNSAAAVLSFYDRKYWTFMMQSICMAVERGIHDHAIGQFKRNNITHPPFLTDFLRLTNTTSIEQLYSLKFTTPHFGCADAATLLTTIAAITRTRTNPKIFVDIGAGVGLFSDRIIHLFSSKYTQRIMETFGDSCTACPIETRKKIPLYLVATETARFRELETQSQQWAGEAFLLRKMLVAGVEDTVKIPCAMTNVTEIVGVCTESVLRTTLPNLLKYSGIADYEVLLLRISADAHDVIATSADLFQRRLIKFVTFEISHGIANTVQWTSRRLWSFGYQCFLISESELIPLNGWYGNELFAAITWQNVFCGHVTDPDLRAVVLTYNSGDRSGLNSFWSFFDKHMLLH